VIAILFVLGCAMLAVAVVFVWLNLNSPYQTRIPLFAGGSGVALLLICLGALCLSACSAPATKTVVQTVSVPVAVQPIKAAQVPTPPAPLGPRPQSLSAAADALLSKVCELEAYVLRADPLLRVSAGEPQQALPKYPECERH